jgi:hypothetical protein
LPLSAQASRPVLKALVCTFTSGDFAVGGFKDEKFNAASEQVIGESPWKEEKMEFATPAGCEAVVLGVRRNESLKMDCKISGDYWLGPVELTEK